MLGVYANESYDNRIHTHRIHKELYLNGLILHQNIFQKTLNYLSKILADDRSGSRRKNLNYNSVRI